MSIEFVQLREQIWLSPPDDTVGLSSLRSQAWVGPDHTSSLSALRSFAWLTPPDDSAAMSAVRVQVWMLPPGDLQPLPAITSGRRMSLM